MSGYGSDSYGGPPYGDSGVAPPEEGLLIAASATSSSVAEATVTAVESATASSGSSSVAEALVLGAAATSASAESTSVAEASVLDAAATSASVGSSTSADALVFDPPVRGSAASQTTAKALVIHTYWDAVFSTYQNPGFFLEHSPDAVHVAVENLGLEKPEVRLYEVDDSGWGNRVVGKIEELLGQDMAEVVYVTYENVGDVQDPDISDLKEAVHVAYENVTA